MVLHNYNPLCNKPIDEKRRATWRWPSSTICVKRNDVVAFAPVETPSFGDLVLTRVTTVGANSFIENSSGCNMSIFPGTVLLGTFGPRYALDEFEGRVPETLVAGQEIDLLNRGGTVGEVISRNSTHGEPTKLEVLAFLKDREGRIANTRNFARKGITTPYLKAENNRTLILVVGTSMNSGKSSTAKAICYALAASGESVVAAKATGQAARRDALLMKAAGASEILDFSDFGYPSTYLLAREEVTSLFWQIYNELHMKAGPGGYIVVELADGIYQRETAMLLSDPHIRAQTGHVVFSCCDSLSAVAGVETLRSRFGIEASAISGPAANSELGLKEVAQFLGDFPAFNNMVMDHPRISALMTARHIQPARLNLPHPIAVERENIASKELRHSPETAKEETPAFLTDRSKRAQLTLKH